MVGQNLVRLNNILVVSLTDSLAESLNDLDELRNLLLWWRRRQYLVDIYLQKYLFYLFQGRFGYLRDFLLRLRLFLTKLEAARGHLSLLLLNC